MARLIPIRSDLLTALVDPDGARLRSLRLRDGPNLFLDVEDGVSPALRDAYAGALVGPVANRVTGGRVRIGGTTYQMPCNESGKTALHSGPEGFDRAVWTVAAQDDSSVQLALSLADGQGGLPGQRAVSAKVSLSGDTLTWHITMTTDQPTPASIAHHPYWRVTPDHRLRIPAAHYLPTDADLVPTGDMAEVAGTALDHRTARAIDANTDHNFCLGTARSDTPRLMAALDTGTHLITILSTEPGLQAYAGAHLPDLPAAQVHPFGGIALEPQGWPDAVNHPQFPSVICTPDHPYSQITQYRVTSSS